MLEVIVFLAYLGLYAARLRSKQRGKVAVAVLELILEDTVTDLVAEKSITGIVGHGVADKIQHLDGLIVSGQLQLKGNVVVGMDKVLVGVAGERLDNGKVHSLKDVDALDTSFSKSKKAASTARNVNNAKNNRFNNFTQRSYDFEALEKDLLTSSAQ